MNATIKALTTRDYIIRSSVRVIAIVTSIYGMAASWQGWLSLSYFTNLSNLMICLALAGSFIWDTYSISNCKNEITGKINTEIRDETKTWKDTKTNAWYIFKFMMTISIAVTFTLYLCFLAPTNKLGFIGAYMSNGASSLCVHFITPLLAILDFILFDYLFRSKRYHVLFATIPPLAYVAFSVFLGKVVGVRWGEHAMIAPYNFLNYGAKAGWFGFAPDTFNATTLGIGVAYLLVIFTLIFICLGLVFLSVKDCRARKMK
ncbi:hypothetical protein [uncultured Gardnerella sp.]|uniref:hypothetical protein n=1 Tax=uncultured Gardnerella sp. TaxID=293424 RepID=UPI0025E54723|nr:hypothetical protein [uncultured Gardnerella sp.]